MATKRVVFVKNNEALVKIEGAVGPVTIDLAVDLLGAGEELNGATQTVNITAITWTSAGAGTVTVVRNAITVAGLSGNNGHFGGEHNFIENGGNTFNIVVTTATAETQVWIRLHKISGYKTKFEPEQFGSYDNTAVSGS